MNRRDFNNKNKKTPRELREEEEIRAQAKAYNDDVLLSSAAEAYGKLIATRAKQRKAELRGADLNNEENFWTWVNENE